MTTINLTNPFFHDEGKAREYLEAQRWPDGVNCPFCGGFDAVSPLKSEAHGPGWYHCNDCRKLFTVRVGGVMERSHIPFAKWALAFHLMAASKKGMSARQMQRMLNVTYKTAWFICHRIREAMKPSKDAGTLGGKGKALESDETYVGGKAKNAHKGKPEPKKHAVHALVERGGHVRATHVADVTAKTLRSVMEKHADKRSTLHTDDGLAALSLGKDFAANMTVVHTAGEYYRYKDGAAIQSAEAFFSLLKRGVYGTFHSISEQHLQRYVDEFAFRWNTRSALGIEDTERAALAIKGAAGKRLTYRKADAPLMSASD
jgi:transposase-like protein